MGTTVRVASILDEGQTFHDNRTPAEDVHGQTTRAVIRTDHRDPRRLQSSSCYPVILMSETFLRAGRSVYTCLSCGWVRTACE